MWLVLLVLVPVLVLVLVPVLVLALIQVYKQRVLDKTGTKNGLRRQYRYPIQTDCFLTLGLHPP
jgi:hypothetical protein